MVCLPGGATGPLVAVFEPVGLHRRGGGGGPVVVVVAVAASRAGIRCRGVICHRGGRSGCETHSVGEAVWAPVEYGVQIRQAMGTCACGCVIGAVGTRGECDEVRLQERERQGKDRRSTLGRGRREPCAQ